MNTKPTRKIIRLPEWDYRTPTYYFVTICTHNRQNLFSDTRFYDIAAQAWAYIPQQRHANQVVLDEWVVMPNHLHGIILLTQDPTPLNEKRPINPLPASLGAIISNYKSLVTRRIRAIKKETENFVWQRGYYERIVRNERELNAIRKYIRANPARWSEDRDNLDTLLQKMRYTVRM